MRSNGERIPFGRTFSLLEDDAALLRGIPRWKAVAAQSFDVVVQIVGQIREIGVVNRRMAGRSEIVLRYVPHGPEAGSGFVRSRS